MNSKECLEKISWRYVNDPSFQEWCNTIKQSLDRLEKLEQFVDIYKNTNQRFVLLICAKATNLPTPTLEQELLRKEILENEN